MHDISVKDIKDPKSILKAFQEALDSVVTTDNVRKALTDQESYPYQHVFWKKDWPSFGRVSMLRNKSGDKVMVFVTVFRYYDSSSLIPLPDGFMERAYLQFGGEKFQFVHDKSSNEYRAAVTGQSEQFRYNARVRILVSK